MPTTHALMPAREMPEGRPLLQAEVARQSSSVVIFVYGGPARLLSSFAAGNFDECWSRRFCFFLKFFCAIPA
ncbi:MAG TPA: hypothetical protein VM555_04730, partial [Tahibacter sp.]|nr:hypothetical protein [Tahibacter sp.]